jgi:integrase
MMAGTKRRGPGDGSVFKRSDGLWIGSVEIPSADGKRRQKRVSSKDYRTAKAKLDDLRAQIRDGHIAISSTTTVAGWLRRWVDEIRGPHIRPKTFDYYDEAIRLHICPQIVRGGTKSFGQLRLARLTSQDVRDMLKQIDSSSNKRRAHKTLKQALKAAVAEGIIARNVVDAVETPEHVKTARGSLTVDAAMLAIKTAIDLQSSRDETEPMLATRWATAFLTGARPRELLGLEWDRVDLEWDQEDLVNGSIDITWQLQDLDQKHGCGEPIEIVTSPKVAPKYPCGRSRPGYCPQRRWDFQDGFEYRDCYKGMVWTKTKTEAGRRIVPIVAPLAALLEQHRVDTAAQPNPLGLVWHHTDGRPISRHDDSRSWRAILTAAELPSVDPYATRHTTATLLLALGVPEEVRMQIMGQSSAAAHAAYLHIDQTQTRAALDRLGSRVLPH